MYWSIKIVLKVTDSNYLELLTTFSSLIIKSIFKFSNLTEYNYLPRRINLNPRFVVLHHLPCTINDLLITLHFCYNLFLDGYKRKRNSQILYYSLRNIWLCSTNTKAD